MGASATYRITEAGRRSYRRRALAVALVMPGAIAGTFVALSLSPRFGLRVGWVTTATLLAVLGLALWSARRAYRRTVRSASRFALTVTPEGLRVRTARPSGDRAAAELADVLDDEGVRERFVAAASVRGVEDLGGRFIRVRVAGEEPDVVVPAFVERREELLAALEAWGPLTHRSRAPFLLRQWGVTAALGLGFAGLTVGTSAPVVLLSALSLLGGLAAVAYRRVVLARRSGETPYLQLVGYGLIATYALWRLTRLLA